MDNQFSQPNTNTDSSPQPAQLQTPTQPVAPVAPVAPPAPSQQQPAPTPAPATAVVQPSKPKRSLKKVLQGLLLILLIVAAAGGVYYWQHQQLQDLQKDNTALNGQLSTAKLQLEQQKVTSKALVDVADKAQSAAKTTSPTSDLLLPGEVSKKTTNSATLSALRKPAATMTAVWIEYGTDPAKLSKSTEHQTKELGLGTAGSFVSSEFNVTQLTSGTQYYYRVAATESGKTIYSGVAGFTVLK